MGDVILFINCFLNSLKDEHEWMVNPFKIEVNFSGSNCQSCGERVPSVDNSMYYFIFSSKGQISHLLLNQLYSYVECCSCQKLSLPNVNLNLPKHLILQIAYTGNISEILVDMTISLKHIKYSLYSISLSKGNHAITISKRKDKWYIFNDKVVRDHTSKIIDNDFFTLSEENVQIRAITYMMVSNNTTPLQGQDIFDLLGINGLTFEDPFNPCNDQCLAKKQLLNPNFITD